MHAYHFVLFITDEYCMSCCLEYLAQRSAPLQHRKWGIKTISLQAEIIHRCVLHIALLPPAALPPEQTEKAGILSSQEMFGIMVRDLFRYESACLRQHCIFSNSRQETLLSPYTPIDLGQPGGF
jgi:hypothetical protein